MHFENLLMFHVLNVHEPHKFLTAEQFRLLVADHLTLLNAAVNALTVVSRPLYSVFLKLVHSRECDRPVNTRATFWLDPVICTRAEAGGCTDVR
jgi:hypothetical protein